MNNLTLRDTLRLMFRINQSKDFICYFSNGKPVIESKVVIITGKYNEMPKM